MVWKKCAKFISVASILHSESAACRVLGGGAAQGLDVVKISFEGEFKPVLFA